MPSQTMIRILIKLGLALLLILGLGMGWLYWKYQDQVKMATKGAGELVDLKQKVESAEAQLVEIRSKLKQQVEEANDALKNYQNLEFNGTRLESPKDIQQLLDKLSQK